MILGIWLLSLASTSTLAYAFSSTPIQPVAIDSIINRRISITTRSSPLQHGKKVFQTRLLMAAKKKNDDDEDDEDSQTGMDEAFRQFGALDSLGNPLEGKESTVKLDDKSKAELQADAASLEQEVKLFKGMLKDSEQGDSNLYSDVIKDMGGTPKEGGGAEPHQKRPPQVIIEETANPTSSSSISIPDSEEERQQFMDRAIQEALDEARSMAPDGKKMSDSILDDEEIMKEIEEIFEKGNEKLIASLEEIRQEQRKLAKISAEQRSKVAMDNMNDDTAERLAAAEASMERQLGKVDKERAEVERAIVDLKRAQADMEADPLLKVSGGVIKPAALAGVLLFSVRSLLDLFAVTQGGIDAESHLMAALIQGAIALACAAFLAFS